MDNHLFRIVYCSCNSIPRTSRETELDQILDAARRNNGRAGVTGALLYSDGLFAQALEGPFDAVQDVFERIQTDHRHRDVVVLQAEHVDHRLFEEWAMAFAEPEDPAAAQLLLAQALNQGAQGKGLGVLNLLDRVVRDVSESADEGAELG